MKIATKLSQLAPVTELDGCRVCGGDELLSVLDLGEQHIGNAFHPEDEPPELVAPLDLVRCADCSMVQLRHSVDSDLMYESYWYRSGVNRTMREHLQGLIREVMETAPLASGDIVIDIGCNDGTALLSYPKDVRTVGVDPSNIRPARAEAFVNDYFSAETLAGTLRGRRARIITSIAMFYDLNEPDSFVQ
ncbi:MAG: NarL family transcriptional regulator, partial [Planctomycetota bacterium]